MKLAAFVVLGLVVTFAVYYLLVFWILETYLPGWAEGGCGNLRGAFLFVLPFSLLVGSILTGFLSYPSMNTKWGLIGIAPGLYLAVPFVVCPGALTSPFDVTALLYALSLYLVSLAAVALGYFLRSLTKRLRRSA
jgi:hypothetical protein